MADHADIWRSVAHPNAVDTDLRLIRADYVDAVGERTWFVLKVHVPNFRVHGFTSSAPVRDLAGLGVHVVADIGSELPEPMPELPAEPDVIGWLAVRDTLAPASGEALLGGPQDNLLPSPEKPTLATALRDGGVRISVARSEGVEGGIARGIVLAVWVVDLPGNFAHTLRLGRPSIVARVVRGGYLLDLHCVSPGDDNRLLEAVFSVEVEAKRCM